MSDRANGRYNTPGTVGRKTRRAEGVNWATDESAPVLSRSVDVASRKIFENPMVGCVRGQGYSIGWQTHGAAQNRREMI
jgi:hypothetical protein